MFNSECGLVIPNAEFLSLVPASQANEKYPRSEGNHLRVVRGERANSEVLRLRWLIPSARGSTSYLLMARDRSVRRSYPDHCAPARRTSGSCFGCPAAERAVLLGFEMYTATGGQDELERGPVYHD